MDAAGGPRHAPPWQPTPLGPARVLAEREWSALRLDGLVGSELGGGVVAADIPVTPADRARSIAYLVPAGAVVVLAGAAWVHTGTHRPEILDVAFDRPVRDRFGAVRPHCTDYAEHDVVTLGGLSVTTPVQTAADLARTLRPEDLLTPPETGSPAAGALRALRTLLGGEVTAQAALAVVRDQPRRACNVRATAVLRALTDQAARPVARRTPPRAAS